MYKELKELIGEFRIKLEKFSSLIEEKSNEDIIECSFTRRELKLIKLTTYSYYCHKGLLMNKFEKDLIEKIDTIIND